MIKRFTAILALLALTVACKKEYPHLKTQVYGHAGESLFTSRSKYPPNTLKSIERSIELGADGVEVDVQMTADNVLVLYHDLELDDYSNSSGCINDKTYSEVSDIKVYHSNEKIPLLKDAADIVLSANRKLYLDIKYYNQCLEQPIDYNKFNMALNEILQNISPSKRELITVNCSDLDMVLTITDTIVQKSYESDDYQTAVPLIVEHDIDMITTKLDTMTFADRHWIQDQQIELTLYNVAKRTEVNKALDFAPEFVISDNIEFTLKSLDG